MQTLIRIFILSLFSIISLTTNAQSIFIVRQFDNNINKEPKICPIDKNELVTASREMFEGSNPKYIIVDLIADGYLSLTDSFDYNINIKLSAPPFKDAKFALNLPVDVQKAYVAKFERFLTATGMTKKRYEGHTGSFSFHNTITKEDILNPYSSFRNESFLELKMLGYYYYKDEGYLRIYRELAKDRLAPLDKALNLDFSRKGFFVHGKRLTNVQRQKYSDICLKYFGNNYYTDNSSWRVGALAENTLEKEIAQLKMELTEQSVEK
ncbi:MAG: hypothetical protein R2800_09170 [Flavipsychrobacter sp.]